MKIELSKNCFIMKILLGLHCFLCLEKAAKKISITLDYYQCLVEFELLVYCSQYTCNNMEHPLLYGSITGRVYEYIFYVQHLSNFMKPNSAPLDLWW